MNSSCKECTNNHEQAYIIKESEMSLPQQGQEYAVWRSMNRFDIATSREILKYRYSEDSARNFHGPAPESPCVPRHLSM